MMDNYIYIDLILSANLVFFFSQWLFQHETKYIINHLSDFKNRANI